MIERLKINQTHTRRIARAGLLMSAAIISAPLILAAPAAADDLSDIKAENAALKNQIESLARDLQELRDDVHQNEQAVAAVKAESYAAGPTVTSGQANTSLSISGQLSRMVFYADDGNQARWFQADNDMASTRLRFAGKTKMDEDWTAGMLIEAEFASNSTADVTIDQNTSVIASNSFTERKLELWFNNAKLGKLYLGQGSTASDGSVEVDLSGTGAISSSGFSSLGSSLLFRLSGTGGTSSGVTVDDLFDTQDGLSRDDRVRYDSPTFAGVKLSTSWVDGDEWDVAARYGREFDGYEVALATSYWDASPTAQKTGLGFSGSVKAPFGTSLTGSYSVEDLEAAGRDDEQFWYVKLGHDFELTEIGGTAVSIDYAETENAGGSNREGTFYSIAAVQKIDKLSTQFYATVGMFEADIPAVQTEDITIGGVGALMKF
ncbi:MAG: porin [Proteobacteria bacterium]|nr:porin [Pseudomonadota bacterium]MDA1356258.1 porin [Pseudomonadota bacterium]